MRIRLNDAGKRDGGGGVGHERSQARARCVGDLKKGKRVKRLIKYYHLLQTGFAALDKTVCCPLKDRNLNFRSYKKNKKLRKFVSNAWDGKWQAVYFVWNYDLQDIGHALMVFPFVKDEMGTKGRYVLRAYNPNDPAKSHKVIVKRDGTFRVKGFKFAGREVDTTKFYFANSERPWAGINVNGK